MIPSDGEVSRCCDLANSKRRGAVAKTRRKLGLTGKQELDDVRTRSRHAKPSRSKITSIS